MIKLENMISIYIVIMMLIIGIYMALLQGKYFETVDHLKKEAKFSKVVGYMYIVLAVIAFIFYLK